MRNPEWEGIDEEIATFKAATEALIADSPPHSDECNNTFSPTCICGSNEWIDARNRLLLRAVTVILEHTPRPLRRRRSADAGKEKS